MKVPQPGVEIPQSICDSTLIKSSYNCSKGKGRNKEEDSFILFQMAGHHLLNGRLHVCSGPPLPIQSPVDGHLTKAMFGYCE